MTGAPKIAAVDLIAALEPVGRGASMGALGVLRPDGDFDLALTIRTFAVADGARPSLGRRRHRVELRAGGRDRGVVGEGAAAARGRRRARGRMRLLAVAVAGRGVVDPGEPVFGAGDEALLRGRAAFETTRVYGGRPVLPRASTSSGSPRRPPASGSPPPDADECERLAATALEAAGEPDAGPPPLLDRDDARRDRRRDPARARGAARARHAARLAATRRRPRAGRAGCFPASSRRATRSTWPARPRLAAAAPTTPSSSRTATSCSRRRSRTSGGAAATRSTRRRSRSACSPGVTRATLLELAPAAGYRVREGAFTLDDLLGADEAFTSSSIREVAAGGRARRQRRSATAPRARPRARSQTRSSRARDAG